MKPTLRLPAVLLAALAAPAAHAVIFLSTGDPTHNTTDPGDGSGWQYEGGFDGVLGTAVAPGYFLTAKHVGGGVGDLFNYNGTAYTTVAKFNSPSSDLTLWQVSGTFSSYAPLYSGTDEVGKQLVDVGRGTQRGDAVTVAGASPTDVRGWLWGPGDGVQRWGRGYVGNSANFGTGLGDMLVVPFDRTSGIPDTMTLSNGDSGGGVFIQEGGVWKLAGINYGVEATFRTSAGGTSFNAAIFDAGGLYFDFGDGHGYTLVADQSSDVAADWVATRVSSNLDWIQSITAVPEPMECAVMVGGALGLFAGGRRLTRRR
ncbi:MAG TPA: hypothetical protein VMB21_01855 [Candidatus Limnocylindria bacterium]|nr:hypothetical protein [Candidatus Limnocylindria bacterium]